VVKTIQRPTLELVARRFLDLIEQVDPFAGNLVHFEDFAEISAYERSVRVE
jgi:hypothetical protein